MRVHGSNLIRRRSGLDHRSYKDYRKELSDDFQHICGYCGKSERTSTKGFEIDHFIPQKLAGNLKNDYTNLVYSCFTCNRKKGAKWPTNDITIAHTDTIGLCDPATEEYDTHLARREDGKIVGVTPVGEYMVHDIFQFDKRPTDVIWKAMEINSLKKRLRMKGESMSPEEKDKYIKIDDKLDDLMRYIFAHQE